MNTISAIRVLPSESNYVMCEIIDKRFTSTSLTETLLDKYNLFIKDLKGKRGITGDYIRIAVKNESENSVLVSALREIFS